MLAPRELDPGPPRIGTVLGKAVPLVQNTARPPGWRIDHEQSQTFHDPLRHRRRHRGDLLRGGRARQERLRLWSRHVPGRPARLPARAARGRCDRAGDLRAHVSSAGVFASGARMWSSDRLAARFCIHVGPRSGSCRGSRALLGAWRAAGGARLRPPGPFGRSVPDRLGCVASPGLRLPAQAMSWGNSRCHLPLR